MITSSSAIYNQQGTVASLLDQQIVYYVYCMISFHCDRIVDVLILEITSASTLDAILPKNLDLL
jgi:hypothetical protein